MLRREFLKTTIAATLGRELVDQRWRSQCRCRRRIAPFSERSCGVCDRSG
jgi:hypothetical protein